MKNLESIRLTGFINKSGVFLSLAAFFLSLIFASQASAAIVINEVYGGGGNTNAPYQNDFVELYNNGTTSVNINGYSVQYAPATSNAFSSCAITTASAASGDTIIEPGSYYLIQFAGGTTGSPLPTPNVSCTTGLSVTAGKVALVTGTTSINGTTCPPTGGTIVDFVGYGSTANCFEGASYAPAGSNTQSIQRIMGMDTNNNSADFTTTTTITPQANAPTAAGATINGRITDSRGRGLQRVVVMMTGGGIEEPIYATTSAFGYYHFEDVPAGNTYILTASSIRYTFDQPTIVININGDLDGADFVGEKRISGLTNVTKEAKPK